MTIKELVAKLDDLTDEERGRYLNPLLTEKLCKLSQNQLMLFQDTWDSRRPFDEFKVEQNKIIRECVALELSAAGAVVRDVFGLPALTEDMEV
jgi:hypothetical protein